MFSTKINESAAGIGLLLLRLLSGGAMLVHGWRKIEKFATLKTEFADPFGWGPDISLYLTLFAEVACAGLIILGLFTRLALIPLIIVMGVAVFKIHAGEPFSEFELAAFYLTAYTSLLLTGPGKFSGDRWLLKK
ncbi:MAG: DoxX family protein [Chitinophagaceae bacterium]|nr:DoxX family protein [Chitinophagaceae bacterium]